MTKDRPNPAIVMKMEVIFVAELALLDVSFFECRVQHLGWQNRSDKAVPTVRIQWIQIWIWKEVIRIPILKKSPSHSHVSSLVWSACPLDTCLLLQGHRCCFPEYSIPWNGRQMTGCCRGDLIPRTLHSIWSAIAAFVCRDWFPCWAVIRGIYSVYVKDSFSF